MDEKRGLKEMSETYVSDFDNEPKPLQCVISKKTCSVSESDACSCVGCTAWRIRHARGLVAVGKVPVLRVRGEQ